MDEPPKTDWIELVFFNRWQISLLAYSIGEGLLSTQLKTLTKEVKYFQCFKFALLAIIAFSLIVQNTLNQLNIHLTWISDILRTLFVYTMPIEILRYLSWYKSSIDLKNKGNLCDTKMWLILALIGLLISAVPTVFQRNHYHQDVGFTDYDLSIYRNAFGVTFFASFCYFLKITMSKTQQNEAGNVIQKRCAYYSKHTRTVRAHCILGTVLKLLIFLVLPILTSHSWLSTEEVVFYSYILSLLNAVSTICIFFHKNARKDLYEFLNFLSCGKLIRCRAGTIYQERNPSDQEVRIETVQENLTTLNNQSEEFRRTRRAAADRAVTTV